MITHNDQRESAAAVCGGGGGGVYNGGSGGGGGGSITPAVGGMALLQYRRKSKPKFLCLSLLCSSAFHLGNGKNPLIAAAAAAVEQWLRRAPASKQLPPCQ